MSIEHAPERDVPAVRKIISKRQLLETIPLSYPTIWQMMRKGEFPLSIVIGTHGKIGWYATEVADWQASCQRSQLKPHNEPEPEDEVDDSEGDEAEVDDSEGDEAESEEVEPP